MVKTTKPRSKIYIKQKNNNKHCAGSRDHRQNANGEKSIYPLADGGIEGDSQASLGRVFQNFGVPTIKAL